MRTRAVYAGTRPKRAGGGPTRDTPSPHPGSPPWDQGRAVFRRGAGAGSIATGPTPPAGGGLMRRILSPTLGVCFVLASCSAGPPDAAEAPLARAEAAADAACRAGTGLKVMTRNLYLGAEIVPLAEVPAAGIVSAATTVWQNVHRTHFPARAEVIADEVLFDRPDVVGLQEVTTWRTGDPVVCQSGNPNDTRATTVVYDYLAILERALRERGLDYEVAAQTTTMDAELCIADPASPVGFSDLRYTDREVLLVRRGVAWRVPAFLASLPPLPGFVAAPVSPGPGDHGGGVYAAALDDAAHTPATACFQLAGNADPAAEVCSWRGWTVTEVRKGDRWVRVFETHAEDWLDTPEGIPQWIFQALQMSQLVAIADIFGQASPLPTLAIGDFNAYVTPDAKPPVYEYLTGSPADLEAALGPLPPSPFEDTWTALYPNDPGYTWGFDALLYGGSLTTRLDLVLGDGALRPLFMKRIGLHDRTWTWQHPSDHAGLVATFAVP